MFSCLEKYNHKLVAVQETVKDYTKTKNIYYFVINLLGYLLGEGILANLNFFELFLFHEFIVIT